LPSFFVQSAPLAALLSAAYFPFFSSVILGSLLFPLDLCNTLKIKSWRYKHQQNHKQSRASKNVAALINEHTHIATDSAGALIGQIRNSILYPQRLKWHKHAKLLETTVHHIQLSKDTIHLYKVKSSCWHPSASWHALVPCKVLCGKSKRP